MTRKTTRGTITEMRPADFIGLKRLCTRPGWSPPTRTDLPTPCCDDAPFSAFWSHSPIRTS
jgi:hypothetical protein